MNDQQGWRKSRRSIANGECVEVCADAASSVHVRDSGNRKGAILAFTPQAWQAFTADPDAAVKAGAA